MSDLISRSALIAEYDRVHKGPAGGARKLMEDAPDAESKYAWHDLRKNPEDLPTHNNMVFIVIGWQDGDREYYTDRYDNGWIRENFLRLGKIIAWREIEPFEEGENK